MRKFEISEKLETALKKLSKEGKKNFEITLKKIEEICSSSDPKEYKDLSLNHIC